MKKQKGITLVALIITIIVMLILVAITISSTLGNNGIIGKSKEASMASEKQSIYEMLTSAIKLNKNGDIDVKTTYIESKDLITNEGKTVMPVSPTGEEQITDGIVMVVLDVKGKLGTYTYTITKEKIIIGRGELDDNKLTISGATSYPYNLRIEPKAEKMFTEDEASALVAETMIGDTSVNNLEQLLVAIYKYSTGNNDDAVGYEDAKVFLESQTGTTISSPQDAFKKTMPLIGYDYKTVQEWALALYEVEDKKLMVNGEEATTGVTWDGNAAIYTIPDGSSYNLELILDGKTANIVKATVSGYAGDLETFGKIFAGKTFADFNSMDDSIYTTYGIDKNGVKSFGSSEVESGYSYYFDIYIMTFKYNGNAYGVYGEIVNSDILMTRVDLLTEGIKW